MILSVLTVSSLIVCRNLQAQNLEETIIFADSQYESGAFSSAIKAYQRALFFSEGRNSQYLFRQIADISYLSRDYESAQKYYGLAYDQSESDSLKTELLFQKAACEMLNKNYQFALIDLLSVSDSSGAVQKRLKFYMGTCYFGLGEFENAEVCFDSCVTPENRKELASLFSKKNLMTPSPEKARVLSMIIPGLGQTYSGDLRSGLNSLALTSGLIVLGIRMSIRYQPIDAILTFMPWYQRYYTGGYGKAEEIAAGKRLEKRNRVYGAVLKLVSEQSARNTLKPNN